MALTRPSFIVVHTAAFPGRNGDSRLIDKWHREKGWSGIGYHFVIINDRHDHKPDGTVEKGRPTSRVGAHALGINSKSIGICLMGHGDQQPMTPAQATSLTELLSELLDKYPDVSIERVIGHREINTLVDQGRLHKKYRTDKSCPGNLIDVDAIRKRLNDYRTTGILSEVEVSAEAGHQTTLPASETAAIRNALDILSRPGIADNFPNARSEIANFLLHPEVRYFGLPDIDGGDGQPGDDDGGNGQPGDDDGGNGQPDI